MKINLDCVLSLILFPSPPGSSTSSGTNNRVSCTLQYPPSSRQERKTWPSLWDGHAGPKLSLGHMLSFVLSGVRDTSLSAQILLAVKWAGPEVVHQWPLLQADVCCINSKYTKAVQHHGLWGLPLFSSFCYRICSSGTEFFQGIIVSLMASFLFLPQHGVQFIN